MGRRSKLDPDLARRFVDMLRAGHSRKTAAQFLGFSESTLYRWLSGTSPQCRAFAAAVSQAEAEAIVRVIAAMVERTRHSTKAAVVWLQIHGGDEWRPYCPKCHHRLTAKELLDPWDPARRNPKPRRKDDDQT